MFIYFFLAKDRKTASRPPRASVSFPPHHLFLLAPRGDYCKAQASNKATMVKKEEGEAQVCCVATRHWMCGGSGPVVSRLGERRFLCRRGLPEVVSNWVSLSAFGPGTQAHRSRTWSVRQPEQHRPWLFLPPGSVRRLWPEAPCGRPGGAGTRSSHLPFADR